MNRLLCIAGLAAAQDADARGRHGHGHRHHHHHGARVGVFFGARSAAVPDFIISSTRERFSRRPIRRPQGGEGKGRKWAAIGESSRQIGSIGEADART